MIKVYTIKGVKEYLKNLAVEIKIVKQLRKTVYCNLSGFDDVEGYFYIAKNGVVESTSRITQRSGQTFREGGTINWIDTDADSGDVYGVYVDFFSGTLGITSEDIRIKVKQIE